MAATSSEDDRVIVWFDIDNTIYSASSKISQAMGERIHAYFLKLGLSHEDASDLHHRYYVQYGLALRGLTCHHDVDPLDFDRHCDGSLPLEDMIKFDPKLVKLFEDIDRTKARVWALTNAYQTHAQRVLRILQLENLIDGLVYCDYAAKGFACKPEPEYYHLALQRAGVTDPSKCYFVDDNVRNVTVAHDLGWGHCVHFYEKGLEVVEGGQMTQLDGQCGRLDESSPLAEISDLQQLREIYKVIVTLATSLVSDTMEFRPRYSQPFTIQQAIGLDVSVINEEIARLQNSIRHLGDTQDLLREHLVSEGHDAELAMALSENDAVIASQQERISMLHFALREKGVLDNGHYAVSSSGHSTRPSLQVNQHAETSNEQGGIDL